MTSQKPLAGSSNTSPAPGWPQSTRANFGLLALFSLLLFRELFFHPLQVFWSSDVLRFHFPKRTVIWDALFHNHTLPLWDATSFCGQSLVGDPIVALLSPFRWLTWMLPSPTGFGLLLCAVVMLGSWGMFLLCRARGATTAAAWLAAVAFAMSGKTAGHVFAGHVEVVSTVMGLPWILWATERMIAAPSFSRIRGLALIITLVAVQGSVQMMYYNLLFTGVYVLIVTWPQDRHEFRERTLPAWRGYAAGIGLFTLLGAVWWWPIVRQTVLLGARMQSTSFEFSTLQSVSYPDLLRFLWPFSGIEAPSALQSDASLNFFWETAAYPTVTVLFLAIVACLLKPRTDSRRLALLAAVLVLLSLGRYSPLNWLAYHLVPGWGYFRVPGRLLFYANGVVALLAADLLSNTRAPKQPAIVAAFFLIAFEVILGLWYGLKNSDLMPAQGLWIPFVVCLAVGGLAAIQAYRPLPARVWNGGIAAVLLLEILCVWRPHIRTVSSEQAQPHHPAAEAIAQQADHQQFRVLDTTYTLGQEVAVHYGLETVTGYHPGIYARFLDVYNLLWPNRPSDIVELRTYSPRDIASPVLLDLLNVGYLIAPEPLDNPDYEEIHRIPPGQNRPGLWTYRRKHALPRAYVTARAELPAEGRTVLQELPALNPRKSCLVEEDAVAGKAEYQEAAVESVSPSEMKIAFTANEPGMLVLSESWHPDWRAEENGKRLSVRRVNHAFIGVPVEKGQHAVRVYYQPADAYAGLLVSGLTLALSLLAGLIKVRTPKSERKSSGGAVS